MLGIMQQYSFDILLIYNANDQLRTYSASLVGLWHPKSTGS